LLSEGAACVEESGKQAQCCDKAQDKGGATVHALVHLVVRYAGRCALADWAIFSQFVRNKTAASWRRRAKRARSQRESILSDYDHRAQRLFVDAALTTNASVAVPAESLNYLLNVLRMRGGEAVHLFNGKDGEFRGHLRLASRKSAYFELSDQLRLQTERADLDYCFAPLKQARLDYLVQKATEMGVGGLRPVLTNHTQIRRLNMDRLRANVIEAAEQCGVLALPLAYEPVSLQAFIASFPKDRLLVFCDEKAEISNPYLALSGLSAAGVSLLIGPEGGFDAEERALVLRASHVVSLSLGPRILRADTAAVAALSLVQAAIGDWKSPRR